MRRGRGKNRGKSTGNKKHNRQGEVKNSIGNGEAKVLICTTHGHKLRRGNAGERRGTEWREIKGEKNEMTVII